MYQRDRGPLMACASVLALASGMLAAPPAVKPTPRLKIEEIASGLKAPWALAFLPDGRVFVTEREGRVRVIDHGALLPEPALSVPDIKSWTKMGLLGMALAPDFERSREVFLAENYGDDTHNFLRIVRYREDAGKLVEPTKLVEGIPAYLNHTGGRLVFGPDADLYITTGDADKPPLAQELSSFAGKILRIRRDGSVPADNPFATRDGAQGAIWSFGHRNPQGLAFQPGTGVLFAPEHGPDGGDEINIVRAGSNYGWPVISHSRSREGMVSPLLEYTPAIGPAAAIFYTGSLVPELANDLLVGCLRGEGIVRVQLDGQKVVHAERMLFRQVGRIREVAQAPDGSIWITTSEFDPPEGRSTKGYDKVLRLTPTGEMVRPEGIPTEADVAHPVGAAAIFATTCAGCHGTGGPALHSSLFDGKWTLGSTDDDLRRSIRDGVQARGMPSYAGRLTDPEIAEVIAYIRAREAESKPVQHK